MIFMYFFLLMKFSSPCCMLSSLRKTTFIQYCQKAAGDWRVLSNKQQAFLLYVDCMNKRTGLCTLVLTLSFFLSEVARRTACINIKSNLQNVLSIIQFSLSPEWLHKSFIALFLALPLFQRNDGKAMPLHLHEI